VRATRKQPNPHARPGLSQLAKAHSAGLVTTIAAIVMLMVPGCLAPRFIPVKGPPQTTPPGVEVVRFPGGPRQPIREGEPIPADAPRVTLEGRMYAPAPPDAQAAPGTPAPRPLARPDALPPGADRAVVLFCHGVFDNNASPMARWFREAGFRVFMLDYRGFGASDPNSPPTVQGFIEDTVAALDYLRSRPDVDPARVVIAGHSMGGAMALAAAARAEAAGQPVRAAVAMGAFSNWRIAVANNLGPLGPLGFLTGGADAPNPTEHARELTSTPVLIVHAHDDSIIPQWHAQQLARSNWAGGGRAQLILLPQGEHVGAYLDYPSFVSPVIAWLTHHLGDDTQPDPRVNVNTDKRLRDAAGR
jgi:alpha-beta hydrolase superfamily lysophospholipase